MRQNTDTNQRSRFGASSRKSDVRAERAQSIAWRLLPFLFLLYVANYLDRTNIAYATLGMKGDLGLTDSVFGTASGIFFIGYFALQIPGRAAGGTLERTAPARDHADHMGRTDNAHRFCAHAAGTLRRAFFVRRGRGRIFSRRDRLSFALVHLSGSRQGDGAIHGRDSNWIHDRRTDCRCDSRCALVRYHRMAMAFSAGRCARHRAGNRGAVRAAGSA